MFDNGKSQNINMNICGLVQLIETNMMYVAPLQRYCDLLLFQDVEDSQNEI